MGAKGVTWAVLRGEGVGPPSRRGRGKSGVDGGGGMEGCRCCVNRSSNLIKLRLLHIRLFIIYVGLGIGVSPESGFLEIEKEGLKFQ